jgi:hypothetical protein
MLDDAQTPGSPGWWLLRLGARLSRDRARFDELECYHRGDHPLPFGNRKMREAYKRLQAMARSNFVNLVAETVLERLKVVGFRSGASGTDDVDRQAWGWWQANSLDANAGLVHRAAVVMGRAYVIVNDNPRTPGSPLVTGEDPRQVIHESSPENRHEVRAALKTFYDDVEGADLAVLYLPDALYYYRSTRPVAKMANPWQPDCWEVDTTKDWAPDGTARNVLGEVPVVPFINRPDLSGNCLGEFEDNTDIQDRINVTMLDRMVISAMQAYRQRYATGIDLEDADGNAQSEFDPGADLLWVVPDDKAKFGEFSPADLQPLIGAIESDIQHLAAITRTPPHYLIGAVVNVSGDALAAAETGLVSKVIERQVEYGEAWEAVYRLAGKVQGQQVPPDCEVIWRDPEFRTLTELASASVQLMSAGVPWRTRMAMLDKSPQEIDRMEVERAHDAMLAASLAPLPVSEGGEVGSRGVAFAPESLPGQAPAPKPAPPPRPGAPVPAPPPGNAARPAPGR